MLTINLFAPPPPFLPFSSHLLAPSRQNTNPHTLYILYHLMILWGHRHHSLFRSQRKWRRLLTTLVDVVMASEDSDDDILSHMHHHRTVPIESRIKLPALILLFEVIRNQRLNLDELACFDDEFIDRLFDIVELTRDQEDEAASQATIRLIVSAPCSFFVFFSPFLFFPCLCSLCLDCHQKGINTISWFLTNRLPSYRWH